jgi:hypothetical protein
MIREELVMDYSPILGVTYGLKNVEVEERDELHDLDKVMNHMFKDYEEEEKKEE